MKIQVLNSRRPRLARTLRIPPAPAISERGVYAASASPALGLIAPFTSSCDLKRRERRAPGEFCDTGRAAPVVCAQARRRWEGREDGMVTVLFIALLAIMMVFVVVESQALIRLRREVKLLEQQQIKRLNASPTNTVTTVTLP